LAAIELPRAEINKTYRRLFFMGEDKGSLLEG